MDLGVGEMGFIFCGTHPLLMTRIEVSNPGPKGPLVYLGSLFHHKILGVLSSLAITLFKKRAGCFTLTVLWLAVFCFSYLWCPGLVCDCGISCNTHLLFIFLKKEHVLHNLFELVTQVLVNL